MELIDKAAVVAEIEKKIKETKSMQPKFDQFWAGQISAFKGILKILSTLEVKEVDLEKEIKSFTEDLFHKVFDEDKSQDDFDWDDIATVIEYTAKHFIELGIQQSNHNKNEEKSYRNHFVD